MTILIKSKINKFNKKILVDGDKSLSIRWALLASQAVGRSKAKNLPQSEDVKSTLRCLKKLGVLIKFSKKNCEINVNGINSFKFKKGLSLDAGNSGTAARLLMALLVKSPNFIKITGDNSLKTRDMKRIIEPMEKFGATFKRNKGNLPLFIKGTDSVNPIFYKEMRGSAQCKSAVMLASLFSSEKTKLKCLPSRNHTELLFKYLKIPIKIKSSGKFDFIEIENKKKFKSFNYKIPGDISSASFLIVLTLLSKKSKIVIKNININPTRTGVITILNKMGASIILKNKKPYKGEIVADIHVESKDKLKAINLPKKFNNSSAIDEFLLIFICCAFAHGVSTFHGLEELNKKESKRLDWSFKILKKIDIKVQKIKNSGIKIWGNPNLRLNKKYIIKNYAKDHRIAMSTIILGLVRGGQWKIYDASESIKTSFPSFLKIIKKLGGKINK